MEQHIPENFNDALLEKYATSFFGYGDWHADYWLVGIEEYGGKTCPDEFKCRFAAWEKSPTNLVDLRTFTSESKIEPNWKNQTWNALYRILQSAGVPLLELSKDNHKWGGSKKVKRGSSHVALIEAMPFPSPRTKVWPYQKWNKFGIGLREVCANKFFDSRLHLLWKKAEEYKPKLIITYGRQYCPGRDIRGWIRLESGEWTDGCVKGKTTRSHFKFAKVAWGKDRHSLFFCIPQPSSFRGKDVPENLGKEIKAGLTFTPLK